MKMRTDQMALLARSIISPDIYSQLLFFFSFLTGFPATSISHLQSILHNAARVIFLKSPFDHVIPLLKTLLRFPVICRMSGCFTWGPRKALSCSSLVLACSSIPISQGIPSLPLSLCTLHTFICSVPRVYIVLTLSI